MSLKSRLARLERRLGTDDSPKRVVIYFGVHETRHEIQREPWGDVYLRVPCPEGAKPMDHLSPEQAALIGLHDTVTRIQAGAQPRHRPAVTLVAAANNPRDVGTPAKVVLFHTFDDGRDPDLPPLWGCPH